MPALTRYCAALLLLLPGATLHAADTPASPAVLQGALAPILAGNWRSDANKARDRYRHPAETLAFFGVNPVSQVIEISPGNGWYSEILAPLLAPTGHYVVAIPRASADAPAEVAANATKLKARFAADPAHFAAAQVVDYDSSSPVFGAPASANVVLTFRNVHNWVKAGTAPAYFQAFFNVLKPGGVLGIEDHRAGPGTALDINSGYLPEDYVIKLATAAGFVLDGRSEINANPKDSKDYPKGVWTLPPTLALGAKDRDKYLAIGESDRFTLRFVKPAPQP